MQRSILCAECWVPLSVAVGSMYMRGHHRSHNDVHTGMFMRGHHRFHNDAHTGMFMRGHHRSPGRNVEPQQREGLPHIRQEYAVLNVCCIPSDHRTSERRWRTGWCTCNMFNPEKCKPPRTNHARGCSATLFRGWRQAFPPHSHLLRALPLPESPECVIRRAGGFVSSTFIGGVIRKVCAFTIQQNIYERKIHCQDFFL